MYLLDTNVVSEMKKIRSAKMDSNVKSWCSGVSPYDLFISVITVQEIEQGVIGKERKDPKQGEILRAWFEKSVLAGFRDRTLPITTAVARVCAGMNVPDPRPLGDALIAATARVHGLKIVTRNVAHFGGAGVDVVNPWLDQP